MQNEIESMRTSSIDSETRAAQNEKAAATFRTQLLEAQEANQEEIRQKLALQARLRGIEDENCVLKEQLDERNEKEEKYKAQLKQTSDQLVILRKQSDTEKLELEQIEEIKRKYVKDSELLQREAFELRAHNDKLDKSRKKLQNDFADVSVELEKYKNSYLQLEKQQKNFDKKLSEEKVGIYYLFPD